MLRNRAALVIATCAAALAIACMGPFRDDRVQDPDVEHYSDPLAASGKAIAELMARTIPRDFLTGMTPEQRKRWVQDNAASLPVLAAILGALEVIAERGGQLDLARELSDLKILAGDLYDETQVPRDDPNFEVNELIHAQAEMSRGDQAGLAEDYIAALHHHSVALDLTYQGYARRESLGLSRVRALDAIAQPHLGPPEGALLRRILEDRRNLGDVAGAQAALAKFVQVAEESASLVLRAEALVEQARATDDSVFAQQKCEEGIAIVFDKPFPRGALAAPLTSMVDLYRCASHFAHINGQHEAALKHLSAAIEWDFKKNAAPQLTEDTLRLVGYFLDQGEWEAAQGLIAMSQELPGVHQSRPDGYRPDIAVRYHTLLGHTLRQRASALPDLDAAEQAAQEYMAAIVVADALRSTSPSLSESTIPVNRMMDAYEGRVGVLQQRYDLTGDVAVALDALVTADARSARRARELATAARPQLRDSLPPVAQVVMSASAAVVSEKHAKYTSATEPAERAAAYLEFVDAWKRNQAANNELQQQFPEAEVLIESTTADAVLESVGRDFDVMIRYFWGDQAVYAWIVSKSGVQFFKVERAPSELALDIAKFEDLALRTRKLGQGEFSDASSGLFDVLVGTHWPGGIARDANVLVVPDGPVAGVPFDALLRPIVPGAPETQRRFMVEDYTIHYIPALAMLPMLRTSASALRQGPPWFLGIADPAYPPLDRADSRYGVLSRNGILFPPLQNARAEVTEIASKFGVDNQRTLVGSNATEHAVVSARLTDFAFLHFAVHGLIPNDEVPLDEPALALGDDLLDGDDGLLEFSEVGAMDVSAYMTVLSSCSGGAGPIAGAEGVLSINTALLISGSDHVVSGLWSVEDSSVAMLQGHYYDAILRGKPPAEALTAAKRWLMTQRITLTSERGVEGAYPSKIVPPTTTREASLPGALPIFWAGLVVYGPNVPPAFEHLQLGAPLGTFENPVRASGVAGQVKYLERLRCESGSASFTRLHSAGLAPDGHIVDLYSVTCGASSTLVHLDLYHPGFNERMPVPGLEMVR